MSHTTKRFVLCAVLAVCAWSSANAADAGTKRSANAQMKVVTFSVNTTQNCPDKPADTECSIAVWMYAAGTYPGRSACVAEIQNSKIAVATGAKNIKIKWTLVPKSGSGYQFDTADNHDGIDLEEWSKPRYQSRRRDFKNPTIVSATVFQWDLVNSRKRDEETCRDHDGATDDDTSTHVRQAKCEIAYVAWVVDSNGKYCDSVDPIIVNGGQ